MKYLWTEDTGAGLHFWKLVNQLFFDDALVVESKESNQGLLDALADIDMKEDDAMRFMEHSGWTVRQVTDRMTDEDNELLIGTSEALWIISIGAYEVEHDILEERVLEQLSYHIPRYEMGKYNDTTPEERELLEKDIALIRSKVELWKLKSYED